MSSVRYNEKDKERLDALPLEDVMEKVFLFGHNPDDDENTRFKYLCPFHNDHSPSFSISKRVPEGYSHQTYYCHVCKRGGHGALQLTRDIMRERGEACENLQLEAVKRLANHFGIKLHGKEVIEQHYAEFTDPDYCAANDRYTCHYSSIRSQQFSAAALKALGLNHLPPGGGREGAVLHSEFHCYELEECRYETDGHLYRAWSTEERPLLEFDYGTHLRKYDVHCTTPFKNTYYRPVDTEVDYDSKVYGNETLLSLIRQFTDHKNRTLPAMQQAMSTVPSDSSLGNIGIANARRLLPDQETGKLRMQDCKVLSRIVICSGQKDAINVFLRSDACVLYPHSETSFKGLSRQLIETCLFLADKVYVLFDADKAGRTAQNELCLRHLELRPLSLPSDLRNLRNPVTGKPCKDITEYFTIYCPKHRLEPEFQFRQMLRQAKDLKFWRTNVQRHRSAEVGEYWYEEKYELDAKSLSRFLAACGFGGVWEKNPSGVECVQGYMHVGPYHCQDFDLPPNVCKIIQLPNGYDYAFNIVQSFLRGYNLSDEESENLENALLTQRKVGDASFRNAVEHATLDIFYWEDSKHRKADRTAWLFYENAAQHITADGIEIVQYKDVPFLVNDACRAPFTISPASADIEAQCLRWEESPAYLQERAKYDTAMELRYESPEQRIQMTEKFTAYERLWRYRPCEGRTLTADSFPIFRLAASQSAIYWQKADTGYQLSEEEQQIHFMYELNLMNAIGYSLYRRRTKGHIHFVLFTDYDVISEQSASGGTGKSTWLDIINLVSPVFLIKGGTMKTGDAFPRNFDHYIHGQHSCIGIDELPQKFDGKWLNGMENGMELRYLYQNMIFVPFEYTPKMIFCTNQMSVDISQPSTFRRTIIVPVSSYFHPSDSAGQRRERNYLTEFGHDPIKDASAAELNAIGWFLAYCLQTFLRIGEPLRIPVDKKFIARTASAGIKDGLFLEWAKQFFERDTHFCRPISISEMQLDYAAEWVKMSPLIADRVTANTTQFVKDLYAYARSSSIQVLGWESDIVRGKAQPKGRFPKRNCWVTPVDANGIYRTDQPRYQKQTDCLYFFRSSDPMPRHHGELGKCGDTDPDA